MLHSVLVIGRLCVASTISTLRMIPMMSQSRTVHCVGRKKGRRVAEGREIGDPQQAQPQPKNCRGSGHDILLKNMPTHKRKAYAQRPCSPQRLARGGLCP